MIITEIKKIGKGERYSIFIDGIFSCTLETEIIVKNRLKSGQLIDDELWKKIRYENGELACFSRSLSLLEKSQKTERQIRTYLKEKGFLQENIDNCILKLIEYGYINDSDYAENFIKTYLKTKGPKKIKYDLITKGVDPEIIEEKLNELVNDDVERENALNLLKKYINNREFNQKLKNKAFLFLMSKGFNSEIAIEVLRRVSDENWD